ncbi:MAG: hypothetical protein P8L72_02820 [Flavobacteriaceae bacterium]|nr:hypothetical protein [Flavobacteriaceae bacterium]MDG2314302.1 hypothetical protein [Flavobacteriaceae bacterium]
MKKYGVLTVLFVFPLVIYLFFASGVNNFAKLPVLTENVIDISNFSDQSFKNKITVLGFLGTNIDQKQGDALNLNQKIYKRFFEFIDFQFVMIQPIGTEIQSASLLEKLSSGTNTDTRNWKFVFTTAEQIQQLFNSLKTNVNLDATLSSPYVFIIDKNKSLRGRDDDEDIGTLYGYDARSVAEINNKMEDDIKVILAEYRLALKKNNADRQK